VPEATLPVQEIVLEAPLLHFAVDVNKFSFTVE
jgi:hypothetical protein